MAQSSSIRTGSWEYHFFDRLEIKSRSPLLNQSFNRPYNRITVLTAIDSILGNGLSNSAMKIQSPYTTIDIARAKKLLNDPEYANNSSTSVLTTGGYRTGKGSNYLVLNPVIRTQVSREKNISDHPNLFSYGVDARGTILHKLGFSFFAVNNTERLPAYMSDWVNRYQVPGVGNYQQKAGKKINYWDVRGTIQTSVTKSIDLQLGYDRNFIGNGYRSLFLSDVGYNNAFFKVNVRAWKINLQSLYIQLEPQDGIVNSKDTKKYLRINTVGINAAKWLNISVFDAVVMGRKNGFDFNYLLPVTFLRAMEQQSGSPDNALFGVNVKANLAGKVQLYGSILLDEFNLTEIKARSGWWANKFGYQAGVKYIDAFNIKNLDLQLETNRVRPFTYTHFDSVSNYSAFNQPIAHPLGANFHEFIALANFQATRRLNLNAKLVYYQQGLDSLGFDMGSNILINYNNRPRSYGWKVGSGNKATCMYFAAVATYELLNNWFVDFSIMQRNFKTQLSGETNTSMFTIGLRINIARREFDF